MEELSALFFELSNDDRLGILQRLLQGDARLTQISKDLDLAVQEVSRQLSRLERIELVQKDAEGLYGPTPYARHVMELVPGLSFLSLHRGYFTSHTLSTLPKEFVERIGSLQGASSVGGVMEAFSNVENAIREAEENIWILSDQILMSTLPLIQGAEERGVEFRLMLPTDLEPPKAFWSRIAEVSKHPPINPGQMETRWLDSVGLTMTLTEAEVAHLSFPLLDGSHDYLGFGASDGNSIEWCRDLFIRLWEGASRKIPDRLMSRSP